MFAVCVINKKYCLIRWLVDESKYYENVPEDENEVSYFTFTVAKDKTIVRCEAQNKKDIDTRTAYVTTFAQGTVQICTSFYH